MRAVLAATILCAAVIAAPAFSQEYGGVVCHDAPDFKCSKRFLPGGYDVNKPGGQCHWMSDLACEVYAPGQVCFGINNPYGCLTKPRCEGPRSTWNEPCDDSESARVPTVPDGQITR